MLRTTVFLIFVSILPIFAEKLQKSSNILQFSLTPHNANSQGFPIVVLNEKFEQIAKFVNGFTRNSTKIQGTLKFPTNLERVVLELGNEQFLQNQILVSLKNGKNSSFLNIHSDDYKMKISTMNRKNSAVVNYLLPDDLRDSGCSCVRGNCACCLDIHIPEFSHNICVNATYNPATIGLDLSIGVDGHYFSEEISIRNPPPICFTLPIPGAEHIAGVCVAFEDLDLDRKQKILSGCVEFEVELIHLRVLHFKLGCFRMPI
uniref:DUF4773 domain-containing protein n=1 Tax=Caenorhabditis japonica TaxID=281687 RepID=A0A8R1HK49_CAEJA